MRFLERVLQGRPFSQPRSSHEDRKDPVETRIPAAAPPPAPPAPRTDITVLLGRDAGSHYAQEVCREYAMEALPGGRAYRSRSLGVSLTADEYGTITVIYLHFNGDAGVAPYPGAIPGRGGTIPKRGSLWAALGRPDQSTDPRRDGGAAFDQWRFPAFIMDALYAADNENLLRLTLRA